MCSVVLCQIFPLKWYLGLETPPPSFLSSISPPFFYTTASDKMVYAFIRKYIMMCCTSFCDADSTDDYSINTWCNQLLAKQWQAKAASGVPFFSVSLERELSSWTIGLSGTGCATQVVECWFPPIINTAHPCHISYEFQPIVVIISISASTFPTLTNAIYLGLAPHSGVALAVLDSSPVFSYYKMLQTYILICFLP